MDAQAFFPPLQRAVFLCRPNRFVAECLLAGQPVRAHLPNPGRMKELLFPGVTLLLAAGAGAERSTAYTAVAVERDGQPVVLDTLAANRVARHLLAARAIPGWERWQVAAAEVACGAHRFDFLLTDGSGGEMLLEVKSCTLFGREGAMFPDAVTARGCGHVRQLAQLAAAGRRCGVLFVVHAPQARWFLPEYHTDPAFAAALAAARSQVELRAMAVSWDGQLRLGAARQLPIPWEVYEAEGADGGVYLAFLELEAPCRLAIGALGERDFAAGHYVYVGAAARGLTARLARHGRLRKRLHWHIDYLRQGARWHGSLPVRSREKLECALAAAVRRLAQGEVAGFGASDCGCPSHLFYFTGEPQGQPAFQELLQWFRLDRLSPLVAAGKSTAGSDAL